MGVDKRVAANMDATRRAPKEVPDRGGHVAVRVSRASISTGCGCGVRPPGGCQCPVLPGHAVCLPSHRHPRLQPRQRRGYHERRGQGLRNICLHGHQSRRLWLAGRLNPATWTGMIGIAPAPRPRLDLRSPFDSLPQPASELLSLHALNTTAFCTYNIAKLPRSPSSPSPPAARTTSGRAEPRRAAGVRRQGSGTAVPPKSQQGWSTSYQAGSSGCVQSTSSLSPGTTHAPQLGQRYVCRRRN